LAMFLLKDYRSIESTLFDDMYPHSVQDIVRRSQASGRIDAGSITIAAVEIAIEHVTQWVRKQTLRAATRGETDTYNVYLSILRSVTLPARSGSGRRSRTLGTASRKLKAVAARGKRLASLGLIRPVEIGE